MTLDEILDWQEQMGTRLRRYGGTLITVAGCDTVQPVDANDNARRPTPRYRSLWVRRQRDQCQVRETKIDAVGIRSCEKV